MKNIILIGFMGAGKTSLAKILTEKLQYDYIDMDTQIIEKSGRSSDTEIFDKDGENIFRELEIAVAKELQNNNNTVISTGGGVVMNKIILDYLKKNGVVVFLKNSFETAQKRVEKNRIPPLFRDIEQAKKLYAFRLPLYAKYADIIVETDSKSLPETAEEIITKIKTL